MSSEKPARKVTVGVIRGEVTAVDAVAEAILALMAVDMEE